MYPCFAEKFHCENKDYIKKSVISIGIVIVWDIFFVRVQLQTASFYSAQRRVDGTRTLHMCSKEKKRKM